MIFYKIERNLEFLLEIIVLKIPYSININNNILVYFLVDYISFPEILINFNIKLLIKYYIYFLIRKKL